VQFSTLKFGDCPQQAPSNVHSLWNFRLCLSMAVWSCRFKSRHVHTASCVTLQETNWSFERARRSSTFACRSRWSAWVKRVRTAAFCASVDTTTATRPSLSHAIDLLYWYARSLPYCCCVISTEFSVKCRLLLPLTDVFAQNIPIPTFARQAIKPICNNQLIDQSCSHPRYCQLWDPVVSWQSTRRWHVSLVMNRAVS